MTRESKPTSQINVKHRYSFFLTLTIVGALATGTYAATLEPEPRSGIKPPSLGEPRAPSDPYEQIAKDHNAGLDAILKELRPEDKQSKGAAKRRAHEIMAQWLRGYFKRKDLPAKEQDGVLELASKGLDGTLPTIDPVKQFGPEGAGAYKELMEIANSASSVEDLDKKVREVESRLLRFEDQKQVAPILMGAAVMRNSAHYVAEHPPVTGSALRFPWKKIAIQDAAGAIIGGIFGGPGGAAAGGLGASVGSAIDALF